MPKTTVLSPTARTVLGLIAQGRTYEQILATQPDLTYLDIFAAAEEALARDQPAATRNSQVNSKKPADPVAYEARLAELRVKHPRAYEPWTGEEDDRLRALVTTGQAVPAIATELQRQPSAVRSHIGKLGLIPIIAVPHE